MAKVNKISSFKSFTEVRKQDTVMKLREENELKRKESVSKLATILDEMGLTSFEGLEEDQKQQIISKIFGDVSEEDIKEIEVEVEEVTESVITEKIDRSVAKRMEGLYLYKKVDEASKILIEVIDDMLEEEFEQEESIEFISLKTQELLENATYATYESVVTEAIDVTGKRDAKKVFTAYKRIMDSMPGISQSKNNNLIKGCIKVLGMYALEDANFHREMSCMNKIKGSISPVEIKVAGLANLAVKVSVNKIKDALQQVTSKVSMAGDWSGIAIAEGTAIYLDSIGATKEGQDMLDMFNSAFESTEELGQKVIEGRAFAAAAKKAKDEGLEEFEFNGKKYPVLIKENTLTESLILEGTRGQFGKIDNRGNITSVYTHYDSYPDNMLPIIKKSFKGGKNVDTILSKGANSGLDSDISKINFYGDGSVANNGNIKKIDLYLSSVSDDGAEYVYLWDEKSKKWMMADIYGKTGLVPAFESVVNEMKKRSKYVKDDLVYNTRTETVGIVRTDDDGSGEVKTDADGNVNVDELEVYMPFKYNYKNAKIAPSTKKEVIKRRLFYPFNESVVIESGEINEAAKLVDEETGKTVKLPYKTKDFRGDAITVKGFTEPHKSSSSGRIQTDQGEFFPGVAGVKIVGHKFESVVIESEEINEAKMFYLIGDKEVSRDEVLTYKYDNKDKPVAKNGWPKWLYTNTNYMTNKPLEWDSIKKDMKGLEKKYGKGNVVVGGATNGGGPYIEIYSKSQK